MKEVSGRLSTKRKPVLKRAGRPVKKEPLVFKVQAKKKKPLGEVDYQALGQIQVEFPYGKYDRVDLCWIRIQTGIPSHGTGVLTEVPAHSPQYKLGQVIRFKKSAKARYATVIPGRVHAANQLMRFKTELVAELQSAMTFNPFVRR